VKVFFIVVGDETNSNSRERVWKYLPALKERGIESEVHVAGDVVPGVLGRLAYWKKLLERAGRSDAIFIHRVPLSATERAALRALGPPVIFDLDDAIWYAIDPDERGGPTPGRRNEDLEATLRMAALVRAGNEELRAKAREFHPNVSLAPTCVDLVEPSEEPPGPVTVGWIGHSGNFRYFDVCGDALGDVRLKVVADQPPPVSAEFKVWRLEDETADVRSFHIGIMPLADTPWARAKCGYKILLYWAHGRPVVASPVGVNAELVTPERGLLARTPEEWRDALRRLCADALLRRRMGAAGREFVAANFSRARGFNDLVSDLGSSTLS
jgi:glycosyltransferase involved in cell wall biosynthesis